MKAPNIQDLVELTLFHALRLECVERGYLPNITGYSDDTIGFTQYRDDIKAIAESELGFAVEVFNNSNPQYKGFKKAPRIVIISENFLPGTTGVDGQELYEPIANNKFQGYTLPNLLVDFTFRIHLIAETNLQLRTITSILAKAIPTMGYKTLFLQEYPEEGPQTFFINNIGFSDFSMAADDIIERVYRYEVDDLLNSELIAYTDKYAKLIEITLDNHINQEIIGDPSKRVIITPPQD